MKVFVYFNSTRKLWSIMHKGRVIRHSSIIVLDTCRFKVSEAGRQRVLRTKKKTVHAGVEGFLVEAEDPNTKGRKRVRYNPYRDSSFMMGKRPIRSAAHVVMVDGKVFI